MLVEMTLGNVSGFDLRRMNDYRWHPHSEQVDLSKWVLQHHPFCRHTHIYSNLRTLCALLLLLLLLPLM